MTPQAITDPARMLYGYTFTLPTPPKCFVVGCYNVDTLPRWHRAYGDVQACPGHDPARHGHTRPEPPAAPQAAASPGQDGARVPGAGRDPQIPPDDGDALPEPIEKTIADMRGAIGEAFAGTHVTAIKWADDF